MILRVKLANYRFTFSFAHVEKVAGVNSNLSDGNHILMWDFDEKTIWQVITELHNVQLVYNLPKIYILETKDSSNYFAYCFKRTPWRKAVEIITYTKHVDWGFIKFGVFRGHFTLRITPKCLRKPNLVKILPSTTKETVDISELGNFVEYETLSDNETVKAHVLEV